MKYLFGFTELIFHEVVKSLNKNEKSDKNNNWLKDFLLGKKWFWI